MRKPLSRLLLTVAAAVPLTIAMAAPPATAATPARVSVTTAAPGNAIPGQYIVTLKSGTSLSATLSRSRASTLQRYGTVLNGFAAKLTADQLSRLRTDGNVAAIEEDQVVRTAVTQSPATWGIDRIDQRNLPRSNSYTYTSTASNVTAYVIDTGVQTNHPDFGGRAAVSFDALGGNGQDCNGHGTHVAGTIGGTTFGVAKGVRLRAVRVLNCSGSGTLSGVIAGMNWVASNHTKPAVANMSLGGGFSSSLNAAANNLAASGVFLAVAAGNSGANACNSSPSSAANATTVAASNSSDIRASWSNFGGCTHLYAPGVSITSDWLSGGTNTISGTSMATPHVAGVGALYKATFGDAAFSTIRTWLIGNATPNVIQGNPSGTPNRLLFKSTL